MDGRAVIIKSDNGLVIHDVDEVISDISDKKSTNLKTLKKKVRVTGAKVKAHTSKNPQRDSYYRHYRN